MSHILIVIVSRLGWLPDAHPVTPSLPDLSLTKAENNVKSSMGQEMDREIASSVTVTGKRDSAWGKVI